MALDAPHSHGGYTWGMAGGAERDESTAPSPGGPPERGEQQIEPTERFGPLAVSRHVKDDGRALILYTRRPDGSDDDGGATGGRPA
jgi:hypothetical protein